jgi:hypothetical protein
LGTWIFRTQFHSALQRNPRLGEQAGIGQGLAEIKMGIGQVRPNLHRGPQRLESLFPPAELAKCQSQDHVRHGMARSTLDRIKRTWAGDVGHWCSRILGKILSHTVAAGINVSLRHRPLDFASLVSS